ncbi:MAG TPA: fatty acid hydroxylase family protein [Bacteroidetes bacterium]|nr:fatty acid hydroxylase family protein [Bacteroidota bacterium]
METYAKVLNYAVPFFITLIIIEQVAASWMGKKVNRGPDVISSLSSGNTNAIKDVLGLSIAIVGYEWLVNKVALFEIQTTAVAVAVAFVAKDFAGYWMHRWEHEINFLWNRHIIHHSSEEFNLSCALRQSISEVFSIFALLMLPAALLGVPAKVVAIVAPIHLFAQFWYHTRLIGKMGFLEKFLVTPSHHRVHHAINPEYLDKNYSQVFIIWDKLFGTFQPEMTSVPPVYGVKRPVRTWNPILINFQHFWLLFQDALRTKNWKDKWLLWFKPTGYRPADVATAYPVQIVDDLNNFEKYHSHPGQKLLGWSWFQMTATFLLMFYLFNNIADIGMPGMFLYGAFLFICIYSYTSLLDKSKQALTAEFVKTIAGLGIVVWQGNDWFGLSAISPVYVYVFIAYLLVSLGVVWYFVQTEVEKVKRVGSPA